ncbi:MAG: mechanosensitive ion channel [Chloroflexota bacterium]
MDLSGAFADFIGWIKNHSGWLILLLLGAWFVWRHYRPTVERFVLGALRTQNRALDGGEVPDEEVAKRAATLNQLLATLVRAGFVLAVVLVIAGSLDLWPAIAGLGLIGAAITLAGQSIVLDYLMGVLILVEGQYYKGDTINTGTIEGVVEQVGLRRTVLRDSTGTVHSISNGLIRTVSNLTRIYAAAVVDIPGVRQQDIETTIAVMNRVGEELAADPAWSERILETPRYVSTTAFTDLGATLRMSGKVKPTDRWAVPAELRRRLGPALTEAGVEPGRRLTGLPPNA